MKRTNLYALFLTTLALLISISIANAQGDPPALTAEAGENAIELNWDIVPGAVRYQLMVWWHPLPAWQPIPEGNLTATTYTHTDLTAGREYYYTIRAVYADGQTSNWQLNFPSAIPRAASQQGIQAAPASVTSDPDFQAVSDYHNVTFTKYLKAPGVHVVAPANVPNLILEQTVEIIAGMLSDRPDLVESMDGYNSIAFLIPELETSLAGWTFIKVATGRVKCFGRIHEMAHMIHSTIEGGYHGANEPPSGTPFDRRLRAAYQNALDEGLWTGRYASTSHREYWAQTVMMWFYGAVTASGFNMDGSRPTLEDRDPTAAALIEETLGDASVPAYCKH